jgi:hypothetical protein
MEDSKRLVIDVDMEEEVEDDFSWGVSVFN